MAKVLVQHSSCESSVGIKLFSWKVAENDFGVRFENESAGGTMKIGVIGLGHMGSAMARRLVEANHEVTAEVSKRADALLSHR